ncbi:MAG TPA: OmpA family protein [Thermoanaerobaculia bacterium]|nr:OmpA family protein [Thermoanaerobaculia bacterium]
MKQFMASILILLLIVPVALAQTTDQHAKAKKGAVVGGVAGAIVGGVLGNNRGKGNAKRGAAIGGVVGAASGAIIGAMMDKQERELRQIEGVNVQRVSQGELKVSVKNEVLFDFDSAALRGTSRESLREMADVFQKYPDTTIRVEGHTDSIGTAAYNKRLSNRRASSVANYLEELGVRSSRIDAIGYGESQPRASNSTANGRQLNRRVEIHIRANAA